MNNEKLNTGDVQGHVIDARDRIVAFVQQLSSQALSSVQGERPDESGEYSDARYDAKDQREQLGRIEILFAVEDDAAAGFASLEDYLQKKCQILQNFPKAIAKPIIALIEEQYDIDIEPLQGESIHYQSCIVAWAKDNDKTEKEVRAIISYEKFEKMSRNGDDIIGYVMPKIRN